MAVLLWNQRRQIGTCLVIQAVCLLTLQGLEHLPQRPPSPAAVLAPAAPPQTGAAPQPIRP